MKAPLSLPLSCALALVLAGCIAPSRPDTVVSKGMPVPNAANCVDSISAATESLARQLAKQRLGAGRCRIGVLPIQDSCLDADVTKAIRNNLLNDLVATQSFDVLKDLDLATIKQGIVLQGTARGLIDQQPGLAPGQRLQAEALVSCQINDEVQFIQIHATITPVNSNIVSASATCRIPKSALRHFIN